jgi:hypothetical protein
MLSDERGSDLENEGGEQGKIPIEPVSPKSQVNAVNIIAKKRPPPMNIGYSEYGI